jgi:polyhydroxyalkanoate synthesis regulator phasin
MKSSTSQKTPCAICGKVLGLFTCRGCQKDFCTRHVAEHRLSLNKQMDELTLVHDRFRQSLSKQTAEPHQHSMMKQIDEWEQQSINKIHLAAKNTRQQLQKLIGQHTTKLTEVLVKIAHDLRKARENGDFFETDVKEWTEKLNKLKKEFAELTNSIIRQEDDKNNAFISPITILVPTREFFKESIGNIQIEDNGQVIVKDSSDDYATARGSGEYTSGQNRFRFKIEQNHPKKWLFIGIISKHVYIQTASYDNPSSYGWAGINRVFLNGDLTSGFNDYKSDVEENDIMELLVDCDQRMISLTNERTHSTFELNIDLNNCPFPWQLNFNLYWANDHVRLLPA